MMETVNNMNAQVEGWESIIAKKQQQCRAKIPSDWVLPTSVTKELQVPLEEHPNRLINMDIPRRSGIMSEKEISITEDYTVTALLDALASGKLSAIEVTLAFSKRAAIAGQLTNCLTETYFEQARERARQLDELKAQGGVIGPLHGLPISLKDGFQITGSEASIGFVSYLGRIAEKNSPLVDILSELGAVIYVKTNIPQTLMTADSHNNIFGRTLNPHNTMLTAGGSSGGEGALVAFRGAPLGVGTDIAGSIRIPSLCDGTYGFRPTASRIPYGGQASPRAPGINFFLPCAGPLANDIDGLGVFLKAVIGANPARRDATALDIPWRDFPGTGKQKLKLGLLQEDPQYPLHPPVRRALKEAARLMQAQGHDIVTIPGSEGKVAEATDIAFTYFGFGAGGPDPLAESGEPRVPSVVKAGRALAEIAERSLKGTESLTEIQKLAKVNVRRFAVMEHWREIWNKYQNDAVIAPSAQHTAVPHDQYTLPPYTVFLNTLDYPACVIPFMKSSKQLDAEPMTLKPEQGGVKYDPDILDGMPCSIQVFTSRMRDEECFEIAKVVDHCLKQKS